MFFAMFSIVVAVAVILRAQGDETIGFGASLAVDDGGGNTFVAIPKIEKLGIPNEMTGNVESKVLDLPGGVIQKLPTLKNGQSFQFTYHIIAATYNRMEAIRDAKAIRQWKFTIPVDDGNLTVQVPGFIETNAVDDVESEKINTATVTVQVSGAQS